MGVQLLLVPSSQAHLWRAPRSMKFPNDLWHPNMTSCKASSMLQFEKTNLAVLS